MPDCDETHYTASVSASPFRKCDYKNMGLTALCNLGGSGDELGDVEPPMWGESVINQYRLVGRSRQSFDRKFCCFLRKYRVTMVV